MPVHEPDRRREPDFRAAYACGSRCRSIPRTGFRAMHECRQLSEGGAMPALKTRGDVAGVVVTGDGNERNMDCDCAWGIRAVDCVAVGGAALPSRALARGIAEESRSP